MQEPKAPSPEGASVREPLRGRLGKVNFTYISLEGDGFSNKETTRARELIAEETPKNDLMVMEYFPPEVSRDPVFGAQALRFPVVTAIAARNEKPVLVVDPAFDSQFLVDFRGIPIGVMASAGGIAAYLIQRAISQDAKNPKPGPMGMSRRSFLESLAVITGLTAAAPAISAFMGEMELKDKADTKYPAEGTIRRIIIARGIQKAAEHFSGSPETEVNALVVYPEWLRPLLEKYLDNPQQLDTDFTALSQMKQVPRLNHYFQSRLFTPQREASGKTSWVKSVREIN